MIKLYKESFSGIERPIWLLSFVQLINRCGMMVIPFLSMYMTQHLGVSITKAGFVMTCYGVGSILGALVGGKLTDKYGYHKVAVWSLGLGGLFFLVLSFIKVYFWICVFTFILSLVNEAFRPAIMTAMGVFSTKENRTRSTSLVRLSINVGWAVGASLGGFLAAVNYQLLFWVDGITNLLAVLIIIYLVPNIQKNKEQNELSSEAQVDMLFRSAYKDKEFIFFLLLKILFGICFFQLFTTLPVYQKSILHLTEQQIGWTMAINGLIIAGIEMVIVHLLSNKNRELVYMIIGSLMMGFSFILFNILDINGFMLSMLAAVIVTFGEIMAFPFMMTYWLNRTNDANRGQYAGLYTTAFASGQVIGPMIGSAVADHFSFAVLWWMVGAITILTSLGYGILIKRNGRKGLNT